MFFLSFFIISYQILGSYFYNLGNCFFLRCNSIWPIGICLDGYLYWAKNNLSYAMLICCLGYIFCLAVNYFLLMTLFSFVLFYFFFFVLLFDNLKTTYLEGILNIYQVHIKLCIKKMQSKKYYMFTHVQAHIVVILMKKLSQY